MGYSSRRHHKRSSQKIKNHRLTSSEEFSDSSEGCKKRKTSIKKDKKKIKKPPDHRNDERPRGKSYHERRSKTRERVTRIKRRKAQDSESCSACSSWSSSSSGDSEQWGRSSRSKRRRTMRYTSSSRSCSCCRESNTSSCRSSPKPVSSKPFITSKIEEKQASFQEDIAHEHKPEVIQSFDDYPSSRSIGSNEGDGKEQPVLCGKNDAPYQTPQLRSEIHRFVQDDLESSLRQKALENFAKFRSKKPANAKASNDRKASEDMSNHSDPSKNTATSLERHKPDISFISSTIFKERAGSVATLCHGLPTSGKVSKLVETTEGIADKHATETLETTPRRSNGANAVSTTDLTNSEKPKAGHRTEANGSDKCTPDLEQKTMSVVRGGELVHVNYQVYIPKRNPALARRKLQR